jgi:hypothetical protein
MEVTKDHKNYTELCNLIEKTETTRGPVLDAFEILQESVKALVEDNNNPNGLILKL